jgi:hypothetical protein
VLATNMSSHTLDPVMTSHAGQYTCRASVTIASVSQGFLLKLNRMVILYSEWSTWLWIWENFCIHSAGHSWPCTFRTGSTNQPVQAIKITLYYECTYVLGYTIGIKIDKCMWNNIKEGLHVPPGKFKRSKNAGFRTLFWLLNQRHILWCCHRVIIIIIATVAITNGIAIHYSQIWGAPPFRPFTGWSTSHGDWENSYQQQRMNSCALSFKVCSIPPYSL